MGMGKDDAFLVAHQMSEPTMEYPPFSHALTARDA